MMSPAAGFAGLEQSGNERRLYVGDYVEFDDLRFTNLRDVEGWRVPHALAADGFPARRRVERQPPHAAPHARAASTARTAAAASPCARRHHGHRHLRLLRRHDRRRQPRPEAHRRSPQARTRQPELEIGKRGTLAGTEWEVIGWQIRRNAGDPWRWDEYLLFNPYRGFRFLAHDDEGWTLFECSARTCPTPPTWPATRTATGKRAQASRHRLRPGRVLLACPRRRHGTGDQYESASFSLVQERSGDEISGRAGSRCPTQAVRERLRPGSDPRRKTRRRRAETTVRVLQFSALAFCVLFVLTLASFGAQPLAAGLRAAATRHQQPTAAARSRATRSPSPTRAAICASTWPPPSTTTGSTSASRSCRIGRPGYQRVARRSNTTPATTCDGSWTEGSQDANVTVPSAFLAASTACWSTSTPARLRKPPPAPPGRELQRDHRQRDAPPRPPGCRPSGPGHRPRLNRPSASRSPCAGTCLRPSSSGSPCCC